MPKKKIFIFEYVSGGGFHQEKIPTSLLCEGFSMLRSLVEDFGNLDFTISTLLDHRIQFLSPILDADRIEVIGKNMDFIDQFKDAVEGNEFCFIIAPEFSNILKNLTHIVNKYDKKLLSIDTDGIELSSSKFSTFQFFNSHNVSTPRTVLLPNSGKYPDTQTIEQSIEKIEFPVILKPDDGVGAESIFYFASSDEVTDFLPNMQTYLEAGRQYVIQDYVSGRDLSVNLLHSKHLRDKGMNPYLLSVNSQKIYVKGFKGNSEYFGGLVPIEDHNLIAEQAKSLLKKLDLRKFSGIFGLDFIYDTQGIHFIEINPRLTTSYIGLRNALNKNPVKLLMNSKKGPISRKHLKMTNHSIFERVELEYTGERDHEELRSEVLPKVSEMFPIEFVTPPISLERGGRHYSCFIATKEKTMGDSLKKKEEIYDFLRNHEFSIC